MTDKELMRKALSAFETILFEKNIEATQIIAKNARYSLREALTQPEQVSGDTSDGYHTFNELYDFRKAYNAALFNEWAASGKYSVHKSKRHFDGGDCFGGGWFIVVAQLPDGQISNHYEIKDWDKFQLPETDKALFEYDNHTGADVLHRLFSLRQLAQPEQAEHDKLTIKFGERAKEYLEAAKKSWEPDAWRNAAIRLGEDLYSVGPDGYYDMTAKQWLDWALSVVNTAPPRKEWVGLTDDEIKKIMQRWRNGYIDIKDVEQLLKDKNT